jgi:hypothetical protein
LKVFLSIVNSFYLIGIVFLYNLLYFPTQLTKNFIDSYSLS